MRPQGGVVEVMSLGNGEPWGVQSRERGGGIRSLGWQGVQAREAGRPGSRPGWTQKFHGPAVWCHAVMSPQGVQPK